MSKAGDDNQIEVVLESIKRLGKGSALAIQGSGSKYFLTETPPDGTQNLSMMKHRGVIDYQPSELMIRVRSGTPLTEVIKLLGESDQILPFDPLMGMTKAGTIGGAVSSGLSGPARPWRGAIRDAVLGVGMISGAGELLHFGGQVMKNVSGYDVSRLVVGAWGTLGVVTEVCMKVLPKPEFEQTRCFEFNQQQALDWLVARQAKSWPFSGAAWEGDRLYIRWSGRALSVQQAAKILGGVEASDRFWDELRDARRPVQRLSRACVVDVPPATGFHPDTLLIDWGGARRWFAGDATNQVSEWAADRGGYVWPWPGTGLAVPGILGQLQRHLKKTFDPENRYNPHLMLGH